jgi:GntR family transcriptional regulator, transcriptional repressor for pyruvate dehydrogenase complex
VSISFSPVDLGRREPTSLEVARRLLDFFLSGEITPGDRMPSERQLAADLGVGRSAVREAITALALLGLVEVRQGDGTYLRRIDTGLPIDSIEWGMLLGQRRTHDLIEARRHLEIVVAGLAATRRDEVAMQELRRLVAEMEAATGDPARFVAADVAFHLCLARATGNDVLSRMLTSIGQLLGDWIARVMRRPESYPPTLAEHRAVMEAIATGNAEAAQAAMAAHMDGAEARLTVSMGESGTGSVR